MKPVVHGEAQFYFIIGEAIWSAVPLPDGGVFIVIRRGAGCFSWTVSPTVTVPRSLPFALLQSNSDHPLLNPVSNSIVVPVVNSSSEGLPLPGVASSDSASYSGDAPVHSVLNLPPSVSLPTILLDEVKRQFRPAHIQTVNAPNPSSPIIKPFPISPLIAPQSATTVGRGRSKLSPSIQPLASDKFAM